MAFVSLCCDRNMHDAIFNWEKMRENTRLDLVFPTRHFPGRNDVIRVSITDT